MKTGWIIGNFLNLLIISIIVGVTFNYVTKSEELRVYNPTEDIFNNELIASFDNGWHDLEGLDGNHFRWLNEEAILSFYSKVATTTNLSFNISSFNKNNIARIYFNDIEIYEGEITTGIQTLNIEVNVQEGENILKIVSSGTEKPRNVDAKNTDDRDLSFSISSISIE